MSAVNKTINVCQGANYKHHILVTADSVPVDFVSEGYTARLSVKTSYSASGYEVFSLTTETGSPANNGITFHEGAVTGRLTLNIDDSTTDAVYIDGEDVTYVYDLEIEDSTGFVTRVYQGDFVISKNVTTIDT